MKPNRNEENSSSSIDHKQKDQSKLTSHVKLTLHTKVAQSLFDGSWKQGKMGLLQFAIVMTAIWHAACEDDPYAEWYLLKTYQTLMQTKEKLKAIEHNLSLYLNNLRGVEVSSCINTNPLVQPLTFATPFGFMGAYLIADLDHIIRQFLMVRRLGITFNKENISIKQLTQWAQEAFAVPRSWRKTNVTREDIRANNEKAALAREQLGEVPSSIINKEIEFSFLPKKARVPKMG